MGNEQTVRIVKVTRDGHAYEKEIPNTLESFQSEVGGYIQTFNLFAEKTLTAIADDEAALKHLPVNRKIPYLRGDVVFAGVDGEDFCSLSEVQTTMLLGLFGTAVKEARR